MFCVFTVYSLTIMATHDSCFAGQFLCGGKAVDQLLPCHRWGCRRQRCRRGWRVTQVVLLLQDRTEKHSEPGPNTYNNTGFDHSFSDVLCKWAGSNNPTFHPMRHFQKCLKDGFLRLAGRCHRAQNVQNLHRPEAPSGARERAAAANGRCRQREGKKEREDVSVRN